eukprot:150665-Lingulodinium_polyedra.AAC.1
MKEEPTQGEAVSVPDRVATYRRWLAAPPPARSRNSQSKHLIPPANVLPDYPKGKMPIKGWIMPLAEPPRVPSLAADSPLLRGAAPQWVGPLYSA